MKWFRLHTDILNDPKVQTLELGVFKIYLNSLCHAAQRDKDGNLGTLFDVSYALRETKEAVSSAFHTLEEIGLVVTVGETFHIPQWKKKQFKSDTSTERVKKHRNKMKRPGNVTVTAPEQNRTDTDIEKDISKDIPKKTQMKKGCRINGKFQDGDKIPDDFLKAATKKGFTLERANSEFEKFVNYWTAASGKNAIKRSWIAAWRTWVANSIEWAGNNNGNPGGRSKPSDSPLLDVAANLINSRRDAR